MAILRVIARLGLAGTVLALASASVDAAQIDTDTDRAGASPLSSPPPLPTAKLPYGSRWWQRLDYSIPRRVVRAPLVIIIPDTMFRPLAPPYSVNWLRYRLHEAGFAVAQLSYNVSEEGADEALWAAARGVARFRTEAARRHFDPSRIIVLGIGSGANFASMLALDPEGLRGVGVPAEAVKGIVAVNGDGFDLVNLHETASAYRRHGYEKGVGEGALWLERWSPQLRLSSVTDKPPFLLMHVAHVELKKQATAMALAYRENGGEVEVALLPREPMLSQPRGAG